MHTKRNPLTFLYPPYHSLHYYILNIKITIFLNILTFHDPGPTNNFKNWQCMINGYANHGFDWNWMVKRSLSGFGPSWVWVLSIKIGSIRNSLTIRFILRGFMCRIGGGAAFQHCFPHYEGLQLSAEYKVALNVFFFHDRARQITTLLSAHVLQVLPCVGPYRWDNPYMKTFFRKNVSFKNPTVSLGT